MARAASRETRATPAGRRITACRYTKWATATSTSPASAARWTASGASARRAASPRSPRGREKGSSGADTAMREREQQAGEKQRRATLYVQSHERAREEQRRRGAAATSSRWAQAQTSSTHASDDDNYMISEEEEGCVLYIVCGLLVPSPSRRETLASHFLTIHTRRQGRQEGPEAGAGTRAGAGKAGKAARPCPVKTHE